MAEFEELRIQVKVDQEKAAENTRQIKDAFSKIADPEHITRFEKLAKSFSLTEVQIKQLSETLGKTSTPLDLVGSLFTKGGLAFLAVTAAIEIGKKIHEQLAKQAERQLEIAHAAERMGIMHAAQLEKNLEQMETVHIDRKRGEAMMETFAQKRLEFLRHFSEFKDQIRRDTQWSSREMLEKHFDNLTNALDANDFMNEVRKFARGIREEWERRGDPGKGAFEERKYLERWFGMSDLMNLHEDFKKVSKAEEEAFDRNLKAAREYWAVTTDIKNNLDKIITSVFTQVMEDLHLMTVLRWIDRTLAANAEYMAQQETLPLEQRDKEIIKRLIEENNASVSKKFWDWWNSLGGEMKLRPIPAQPQKFMGGLDENQQDLITEEKRLVENLQALNAILSGAGAQELGVFGTKFHNRPQGGAAGESNPMQLPASASQPGGGAAAEARKPYNLQEAIEKARVQPSQLSRRDKPAPGETPVGYYIDKSGNRRPFHQLINPLATAIPLPPGYKENQKGNPILSGVSEGLGVATVFSRGVDVGTGKRWGDKEDDPESNALRIPDRLQGISLANKETLGEFFYVTDMDTLETTVQQQTEVGPNVRTQAIGDFSVAMIQRLNRSRKEYEAAQDKKLWLIENAGFGTKGQPNVVRPKGVEGDPTQKIVPTGRGGKPLASGMDLEFNPFADRPSGMDIEFDPFGRGKPSGMDIEFDPFKGKGGSFGGGGATSTYEDLEEELNRGRSHLDRSLGDELDVKGKLNVDVDAPRGTEVKAKGDGMFEGGVTVNRSMGDQSEAPP